MKTNDLASILEKKKDLNVNNKQFELANRIKINTSKFDKADNVLGVDDAYNSGAKEIKPVVRTVKTAFTLPEDELLIIDKVVERVLRQGKKIHKSHIIRIGLQIANRLSDEQLIEELSKIEIRQVGKHLG